MKKIVNAFIRLKVFKDQGFLLDYKVTKKSQVYHVSHSL